METLAKPDVIMQPLSNEQSMDGCKQSGRHAKGVVVAAGGCGVIQQSQNDRLVNQQFQTGINYQ
jgi:hypothetical protein